MLDGNTYYDNLNLSGCTSLTSLPENLTVKGSLDLSKCTRLTTLPRNLTVGKNLNLSDCTGITSLPEHLTVGGSLDLSDCTAFTSLPENLTVINGDLRLAHTALTSLPENLTVTGELNLTGCTGLSSLPKSLTSIGKLYLSGCTGLRSLPENLTVDNLYISGCTELKSLPENLTVCRDLDLTGCTEITSLPGHLTVGGKLNLEGTGITKTDHVKRTIPPALFWQDGKYIMADGIFSRVVSHDGNVYRVASIWNDRDRQYLVTDGNGKWTHGYTLESAKEDLKFKITDRDTSKYKGLPLDHEFSEEEAIECYRIITGVCGAGTKDFLLNELPQEKRRERYTIAQMIELTEGQYGAETFKTFFMSKE